VLKSDERYERESVVGERKRGKSERTWCVREKAWWERESVEGERKRGEREKAW
jgi:hypothetical protein